jgi:flagellar basal-body rod protein FlgC
MPSFVKNLLALPPRTKAILAVSSVAIIAILFFMLKLATAPSYTLLSSGLDPAQTGKITAALDAQGITYELRNNGTALAVNKAQVPQARIALASQGVAANSSGSQEGYALLDKTKLGTSQFQQQVTYQRALEGELANMINGVEVAEIASDQTAGKMVYDPSHPDANAQGYVQMPNVDTVTEMVDLIDSSRAYEANVTAMQASKQMFTKTLDLLK